MIVYGKYECFVMQMLYVCVLCSQRCIMHDLQFVNHYTVCESTFYLLYT